jgi:hypothetical protein
LKKILNVDIENYWVKKTLLKVPAFNFPPGDFLFKVMHLPELKAKFESRINYEEWERLHKLNRGEIPLKTARSR